MRSKAPLTLMEQAIMLLVFALAAAVCLRCFVWADQRSRRDAARDQAVILAQNAAETLKAGGQVTTDASEDFILTVEPTENDVPGLWTAEVRVTNAGGEVLASLPVAGQEVGGHG